MLSAHPWLLVASGVMGGIVAVWMTMGSVALPLVWLVPVVFARWTVINRGLWSVAVLMGYWCAAEEGFPRTELPLLLHVRVTAWVKVLTRRGSQAQVHLRTFDDVSTGVVAYVDRPLRGIRPGAAVVVEGPLDGW